VVKGVDDLVLSFVGFVGDRFALGLCEVCEDEGPSKREGLVGYGWGMTVSWGTVFRGSLLARVLGGNL